MGELGAAPSSPPVQIQQRQSWKIGVEYHDS